MISTYIVIYSSLFGLFAFIPRFFSVGKSYWHQVLPIIIAFTFTEGLRYMRGVDYHNYMLHYEYPELSLFSEDFGFYFLNRLLRLLKFNYVGAFSTYALITILSLCLFMKYLPEIWKWGFLIMLSCVIFQSEWMIRQFISIAILYTSLYHWFRNNYKIFSIIAICGCLIHYSSLFFVMMIIGCSFLKKTITPRVSITLLFLFAIVLNSDLWLPYINSLLDQYDFASDKTYSYYMENKDDYLNQNAKISKFDRSFFTTIITYLFYVTVYIEGHHALKNRNNNLYVYIFNLFVVGSILFECFLNFELFKRFAYPLLLLWFVPVSYILCVSHKYKFPISPYILWFYILAQIGRFVFTPLENMFYFIWDA